jgi:DnaK suppressor protein
MSNLLQVRAHLEGERQRLAVRHAGLEAALRAEPLREPDALDAATAHEDDEVMAALDRNETRMLAEIEAALKRIDLGSYGLCATCGEAIGPERLAVMPHASTCTSCAEPRRRT